nr:MAG TPA: hypothetical protein [Caudoviricetes sp.]
MISRNIRTACGFFHAISHSPFFRRPISSYGGVR